MLEELRVGGDRPEVPLILLSGTTIDPSRAQFRSEEQLQEQIDGSRRLYAAVVAVAPDGEYRAVPEASHSNIPMISPDAVSTAIADILERHLLRRISAQ